MKRTPVARSSRSLRRLGALVLIPALIALAAHALSGPGHVLANTSQGPPAELSCLAGGSGGSGPALSCVVTVDFIAQQGEPLTLTPLIPAGSVITGCTASDPRYTATAPGGTLPTYIAGTGPSAGLLTQSAIGSSVTVPANTCAYTQIAAGDIPAGTVIGGETLTLGTVTGCNADILRELARAYQGNGTLGAFGGNPVTISEEGFEGNISGGPGSCLPSSQVGVTDTLLPGQKSCTFTTTTATCSVNNDVFLVTGSTLIVSPATPAGSTVTGCTSSGAGIVATPAGGTLPTVTLVPTFGGAPFASQASLNGNTTVPPNTCAYTVTTPTPPAEPAGSTLGTETITFANGAGCGTELTQQITAYIPNGTAIVLGPPVTYPVASVGTVSGGFLCGASASTPVSGMTTTGSPAQLSCAGAGGSATCTLQANVYVLTGDTMTVQFQTPSGVVITGCGATDPRVIATSPGGTLPAFNQQGGAITTSGTTLQSAMLDSTGTMTLTTVPANTCAFTYTGTTPPGFPVGSVIGTIRATFPTGAPQGTEITGRVNLYAATTPSSIPFGFGAIAGSGPTNVEFVTNQFAGTVTGGLLGAPGTQQGQSVVLASGPLGTVLLTGCGNVDVLSSAPSASGVPAPNSILSTIGIIPAGEGPGTTLYLLAIPCPGSTFVGWSGGPCAGTTTNPCQLTILSGVIPIITANFLP